MLVWVAEALKQVAVYFPAPLLGQLEHDEPVFQARPPTILPLPAYCALEQADRVSGLAAQPDLTGELKPRLV